MEFKNTVGTWWLKEFTNFNQKTLAVSFFVSTYYAMIYLPHTATQIHSFSSVEHALAEQFRFNPIFAFTTICSLSSPFSLP